MEYDTREDKRLTAYISLSAVEENFEAMKRNLREGTKITAVIKADAYGHGALPIARMMEPKEYIWGFATATAQEAVSLYDAGIRKPILILGHVFEDTMEMLAGRDIRIAVSSLEMAECYAQAGERIGKKVFVHLALDTGMSRIGFADDPESLGPIREISRIENLQIEGLFTHFARADETDVTPARIQLERYTRFADLLEKEGIHIPIHHCSNSAGIIRLREANMDMVRAGITIYGIYPSDEVEKDPVPLRPVMSLVSHVSHVKTIKAGTAVSYGGTYTAPGDVRLATIPVGYADGYPRLLSGKGWVLIRGKKAPICGRVCMDQFMVDVSDIEDVTVGTPVVLLGSQEGETITVETLGELSGRFPYEFVCDVGKRVPRVYTRD